MSGGLDLVAFAVLGAVTLLTALRVATTRNLVHTVLWLGLMLASTAGLYVLLNAPFLAAIQLILYTGGVLTLMLFGVMLTHRDQGFMTVPNPSRDRGRAALLAVATFGVLAWGILSTAENSAGSIAALPDHAPVRVDTAWIGRSFLTEHVLAFEVLSALLLAAVLGAIVLARKQDPTLDGPPDGPRIASRRDLPRPGGATSRGGDR